MNLLIDYIIATTYLYGIVDKDTLLKIYNTQNDKHISIKDIEVIMICPPDALNNSYVYIENDHFVHETICEFNEFDYYIKKKSDKPYYIPEQSELLKYVDDMYFEKNEAYYNLKDYMIKNYFPNDIERAIDFCDDVQISFSLDYDVQSTFDTFSFYGFEPKNSKKTNEIISLLQDFSNHTRRWVNNGHTPIELFERYSNTNMNNNSKKVLTHGSKTSSIKKQKVGRNDLCPCGSGKKYKRCCLNK